MLGIEGDTGQVEPEETVHSVGVVGMECIGIGGDADLLDTVNIIRHLEIELEDTALHEASSGRGCEGHVADIGQSPIFAL